MSSTKGILNEIAVKRAALKVWVDHKIPNVDKADRDRIIEALLEEVTKLN